MNRSDPKRRGEDLTLKAFVDGFNGFVFDPDHKWGTPMRIDDAQHRMKLTALFHLSEHVDDSEGLHPDILEALEYVREMYKKMPSIIGW